MSSRSFWGTLEDLELMRSPSLILQEQAEILNRLTNEVLEGKVERFTGSKNPGRVTASLYIVAPALQYYKVRIVAVEYSLGKTYPATVRTSIGEVRREVDSEIELEDVLRTTLSSESTRNVLSSLINESQMTFQD